MDFLHLIEGMRTPALTLFFSIITKFGEEYVMLILGCVIYWCINKKTGIFILTASVAAMTVNSILKTAFCVPRPWLKDPTLKPVEGALETATGYSFPSGHTSSATSVYGCIAVSNKRKGNIVALCLVLIGLVMFSRLYLGVHTPTDVLASFAISAAVVFLMLLFVSYAQAHREKLNLFFIAGLLLCSAFLIYTVLCPLPQGDLPSLKADSYSICGMAFGTVLGVFLDYRFVKFKAEGSVCFQIVKTVLGLICVITITAILKHPLQLIMGYGGNVIRYFLVMLFITFIYPLVFERVRAHKSKIVSN